MTISIRLAALVLGITLAGGATAQTYPSAPITMVVPFAAGSGTDAIARVLGKKLAERLGHPVLIDNRPGANAQIGAAFVAKAKPDGYTLLMTTNTAHSANPGLYTQLHYDPVKDFAPIALVAKCPFALSVNRDLPVKTTQELIAYAKANPGKLSYATPNSTSLVASETFKSMAGLDILGVPYKSSPQAMTDLIAGQVQMYVADLSSGMPMFKSGKVRVLGVTTAQRNRFLPDVPAIADTLPGFDLTSWNGILAPAGTPDAIVKRLNTEIMAALADPETQSAIAQVSYDVVQPNSPREFGGFIQQQLASWAQLIKQAGIQPIS